MSGLILPVHVESRLPVDCKHSLPTVTNRLNLAQKKPPEGGKRRRPSLLARALIGWLQSTQISRKQNAISNTTEIEN